MFSSFLFVFLKRWIKYRRRSRATRSERCSKSSVCSTENVSLAPSREYWKATVPSASGSVTSRLLACHVKSVQVRLNLLRSRPEWMKRNAFHTLMTARLTFQAMCKFIKALKRRDKHKMGIHGFFFLTPVDNVSTHTKKIYINFSTLGWCNVNLSPHTSGFYFQKKLLVQRWSSHKNRPLATAWLWW